MMAASNPATLAGLLNPGLNAALNPLARVAGPAAAALTVRQPSACLSRLSSPPVPFVDKNLPGEQAANPLAALANTGALVPLMDEKEAKRMRRKQSNRESARRSRLRKQAEVEDLQKSARATADENQQLRQQVQQLQQQQAVLVQHLARCQEEINRLKGKPATTPLDFLPDVSALAAAAMQGKQAMANGHGNHHQQQQEEEEAAAVAAPPLSGAAAVAARTGLAAARQSPSDSGKSLPESLLHAVAHATAADFPARAASPGSGSKRALPEAAAAGGAPATKRSTRSTRS